MVYEILSSMILPLLIAASGISVDMPSSEPSYVAHDTSIIQVPKPDGTQYWRYVVSGAGQSFVSSAFDEQQVAQMRAKGYLVRADYMVTSHDEQKPKTPTSIMQRLPTHEKYNGTGITIAIIDSGVDFSNTDIRDSLARDEFGFPIMLDADGQGIVLTNITFASDVELPNRGCPEILP